METFTKLSNGKRICSICQRPLSEDDHGNRKSHPECAYKEKLLRQKSKYKIGNSAKLMIQKNEAVAARLHQMDKQRNGIPFIKAMEQGLKFDCPSTIHLQKGIKIYFFENYGYSIETINGETLIFMYNESDIS